VVQSKRQVTAQGVGKTRRGRRVRHSSEQVRLLVDGQAKALPDERQRKIAEFHGDLARKNLANPLSL
jgi:hypothetical protein